MARHWFAFASGFVLATWLTSISSAQSNAESSQMPATPMRPGWVRTTLDPADTRNSAPASTQMVENSTPSSSGSGFSLLPSWLNFRGDNAQQTKKSNQQRPANQNGRQATGKPSNNQSHASNTKVNSGARPSGQMPADSLPPDPATMPDVALPGLGGSPLPRKGGTTANSTPANAGLSHSPLATPSRTAGTNTQSAVSSNVASPRVASREPLVSPTTPPAANGSTTRNSPARRSAPHISPDEMRRELTGAFPATSGAAETARETPSDEYIPTAQPTKAQSPRTTGDGPVAIISDDDGSKQQSTEAKPAFIAPSIGSTPSTSIKQNETAPARSSPQAKSAFGAGGTVRVPFNGGQSAPQTARGKEAFGEALQVAGGGDPNVLATSQTPVITSDIRGPKQIQVGREALYRVRLQNQSDVPAEGIVATIKIPSGAEVMNTSASQGMVQPAQDGASKGQLQWQLARLDRRGNETLEIHLVPHESRPLELGVSWTVAPVGSRAVVEVQEAKLQLEIAGPTEVLFDKPQLFKLTLSNPGTGPAENVKIDLLPPGGSQDSVTSHKVGDLAPGASQTIEVELTAREAGKMFVKATATAEGGLSSEASKEIFCRKPELEVDYRGPATKYAGTMATYYVRVRNPGTAPAEDVTVRATLPDGAEFTSASEGQMYDTAQREVAWRVGTLAPGDDSYMELKCVLKSPGTNRVKMSAAASNSNLADTKVGETNVVAIADLKLDVTDPSGPVAVGTQAVYEIHIRNRGASAAKDVNVVALFSDGIEPEQADGAQYTVTDGRVSFRTIDELPAGRDVVLKIRAHAVQPGTHVFRAEVLCRDLEIKLAAEETTRFYADDSPSDSDKPQKQSASRSDMFGPGVK